MSARCGSRGCPRTASQTPQFSCNCRVDAFRMRQDLFQKALLPKTICGRLVVENRVDRNGRLRQPICQGLLACIQRLKAGSAELKECGVADALNHNRTGCFLLRECCDGIAERKTDEGKNYEEILFHGWAPFEWTADQTLQATTIGGPEL